MGEVYLGEQVSLSRPVAIKLLRSELNAVPGMAERFRREAHLLSTVDHPSVVRVIDYGDSDGAHCLVLEFVEGRPLTEALSHGALEPLRAVRLLRQIADGLSVIHSKGIVHRDLKPDNVLLAPAQTGEDARLCDFGIARLLENDDSPAMTQAGLVLGTPEYLSPEQASGKNAIPASDVYSFGVLAYRMLCGKLPFEGPSVREYLLQHLTAQPPSILATNPDLATTPALSALVMRCLEKDAARRPQTGLELAEALSALDAVLGTPTPESAARTPIAPRTRLLAAAAVALFGIVAIWFFLRDGVALTAEDLLEAGNPGQALSVLESSGDNGKPRRQRLRARALHKLRRHTAEWEGIAALKPDTRVAVLDGAVASGLAEDFASGERDRALLKALEFVPRLMLVKLAESPLSPSQWGALLFLDQPGMTADLDLVDLYIASLQSAECEVCAAAARRLGDLHDARAVEPLERLLKAPRKPGFLFFERSCGHNEAKWALRRISATEKR
jgi:hypothetical protein